MRRLVIDLYDHTSEEEITEITESMRGIGLDDVRVTMTEFVLIAQEPGRHGFSVVGGFDSVEAAEKWRDERKLDGMVKSLVASADWREKDGSMDDEALDG